MWMLGAEPRSSARVAITHNHWAISRVPLNTLLQLSEVNMFCAVTRYTCMSVHIAAHTSILKRVSATPSASPILPASDLFCPVQRGLVRIEWVDFCHRWHACAHTYTHTYMSIIYRCMYINSVSFLFSFIFYICLMKFDSWNQFISYTFFKSSLWFPRMGKLIEVIIHCVFFLNTNAVCPLTWSVECWNPNLNRNVNYP